MVRLYLAQMEPVLHDKASNLAKMFTYVKQAAALKADLILFPELALTGYFTRERTAELAEDTEGPSVKQVREWAKTHNLKIIFGFAERKEGKLYNSACFVNHDGTVIGTYQKLHLWDEEGKYFSAGDTLPVWETDIGKIGIMICYDTEFPETSRILALQGAEMILAPTANMSPLEHLQQVLIQSRALENQVFVATTNRIGTEETTFFFGHSAVANPFGKLLLLADQQEGGHLVECDLDQIRQARTFACYLNDRRVSTYRRLVE